MLESVARLQHTRDPMKTTTFAPLLSIYLLFSQRTVIMFNENFPDWSYKINILRYVRSANIRKESYAVLGPLPKIHCE